MLKEKAAAPTAGFASFAMPASSESERPTVHADASASGTPPASPIGTARSMVSSSRRFPSPTSWQGGSRRAAGNSVSSTGRPGPAFSVARPWRRWFPATRSRSAWSPTRSTRRAAAGPAGRARPPQRLVPRSRRRARRPRRSGRLHTGACRSASRRDAPLPDGDGRLRYRHRQSALFQDRQGGIRAPSPLPRWFTVSPTSTPFSWRWAPHCCAPTEISFSSRRAASRRGRTSVASGPSSSTCPTLIHVFGSRRDAFVRDEVLQENVILSGVRRDRRHGNGTGPPLVISSSRGVGDIDQGLRREVPADMVLDLESGDRVLRLPIRDEDEDALTLVDSWPNNLRGLGLNISTGPVVPFRATKFIDRQGRAPASHVPLLWMGHVHAMRITWPLNRRKPEYIRRSCAGPLLVPNGNYVLLRRFSAKEEARRLAAAPYLAARFVVPKVGKPSELCPSARRRAFGRRGLGFGGALQQPPPRHLVPRRQRQHSGERHRAAGHAASRARDDRRARPARETAWRGGAGRARNESGGPSRAEGGGQRQALKKRGRSSERSACRRRSATRCPA